MELPAGSSTEGHRDYRYVNNVNNDNNDNNVNNVINENHVINDVYKST